jgi:hypothetical protein
MNEKVHGVTPGCDESRLCATIITERVDTSRAKSIRGNGEVPWTSNKAGALLDTSLLLASLTFQQENDMLL